MSLVKCSEMGGMSDGSFDYCGWTISVMVRGNEQSAVKVNKAIGLLGYATEGVSFDSWWQAKEWIDRSVLYEES